MTPRAVVPLALAGVALAVFARYGIETYPITHDRAYFLYVGQAVLRGEPYYRTTFMGYPPLGALLTAAAMWVGTWFDVPTYLAPRYLSVAVGTTSVVLVYALTREAVRGASAGILAGVVLAGFAQFGRLTVADLEPKSLVVLFTLATCVALQRRRWLLAGAAAGAAASCWHPAGLVPLAGLAVVVWGGVPRARAAVTRYVAGGLLASVPSAAYLTLTNSWGDFWVRAVLVPAAAQLPHAGRNPLHWLEQAPRLFATEAVFLQAAALAFAWFVVRAVCRGPRRGLAAWLHPRMGSVPLLTLAWSGFNSVEFGLAPDLLPMLPLAAFWVGWASRQVATAIAATPGLAPRAASGVSRAVAGVLVVGAAVYGFADVALYRPATTLPEQKAIVDRIVAPAGPDGVVMAVEVEEVYVLSERRSPNRFLRFGLPFLPFIHLVHPRGCPGVVEEMMARRPAVVVVRRMRWPGPCQRLLERGLAAAGYGQQTVTMRERQLTSFRVRDDAAWVSRWSVYTSAAATASPPATRPAPRAPSRK